MGETTGLDAAMADIVRRLPSDDATVAIIHANRLAADVARVARILTEALECGFLGPQIAGFPGAETRALSGASDLHHLLSTVQPMVDLSDHLIALGHAMARCVRPDGRLILDLSVPACPIDGTAARWLGALLVCLLSGASSGAPVETGSAIKVSVVIGMWTIDLEVRDMADDPPDRLAVGGELLERLMEVTRSVLVGEVRPGLVTIRMPCAGLSAMRCAGHA